MKRRQFLQGTAAAALFAPTLAREAMAQAPSPTVLKMAPQANLTSLDPIWTTATVTNNHGYYVFDTLYGGDLNLKPQPQMAEGHEISADGKTWKIRLRSRSPRRTCPSSCRSGWLRPTRPSRSPR